MANLSSIFLSLNSPSASTFTLLVQKAAGSSITTQVQLLSVANMMSRLVIGPLADFIAPVPISYMRPTADESEGSPRGSRYELGGVDEERSPLAGTPKGAVYYAFPRRHYLSRMAFLLCACALLLLAFASFIGAGAQGASMGVLSVGVGVAYGTTFTILYVHFLDL